MKERVTNCRYCGVDLPEFDHSDSSLYCNHANESGINCDCDESCYCRVHGNCRHRVDATDGLCETCSKLGLQRMQKLPPFTTDLESIADKPISHVGAMRLLTAVKFQAEVTQLLSDLTRDELMDICVMLMTTESNEQTKQWIQELPSIIEEMRK
jgi:hypothetical protein